MIRDPSDGSVREEPLPDADEIVADGMRAAVKLANFLIDQSRERLGLPPISEDPVIHPTTSGLQTGSTKPENLARLEKSKTWLRDYRAGKINPKAEGE
jgi:hypothetical protein